MSIVRRWSSYAPYFQSILRIVAALSYITHGTMKLIAFPASAMGPGGGTLPVASLPGIGGVLEIIGGPLLVLGLFTRPVAFLLSGEMAVAYFTVHLPQSIWPILSGGEVAMLFCFIWLYFSAAGAGPWSLDAMRERNAAPGPVGA